MFFFFFLNEWKSKEQQLFEMEIFCNINVFNVTPDQFNASLLNKRIHLLTKSSDAKFWMAVWIKNYPKIILISNHIEINGELSLLCASRGDLYAVYDQSFKRF